MNLIFCFIFMASFYLERERETNVENLIISPTRVGGQIHFNLVGIRLTSTIHFDRQSASSLLKPTFILSSSTCFFHVLFNLYSFHCPSASKINAINQNMTILSPKNIATLPSLSPPTSCSGSSSSLTSSTCTHPATYICELSYCFNFTWVFVLFHCLSNISFTKGDHKISPFPLLHIHHRFTPHCTCKTEWAFTLKLQTPHGSTFLLCKPCFVMPRHQPGLPSYGEPRLCAPVVAFCLFR